jgi:hypothetical protein
MRLLEGFHRPENWDKCSEGTGWLMYCGANDWENSTTYAWVIFPSDEANRRIWFKVKYPEDCVVDSGEPGSSNDEMKSRCKKYGEKAWRTWIRLARDQHKNRNHGSRSWKDAFKSALYSKEMASYVEEKGEEATKWDEVKEALAKTLVRCMLESEEENEEEWLDRQLPTLRSLPSQVDPENVDALEIHPLNRYVDEFGQEQVDQTLSGETPNCYGVFVHLIYPGGIDDATAGDEDFATPEAARQYAQGLSQQFGWAVYDYTR